MRRSRDNGPKRISKKKESRDKPKDAPLLKVKEILPRSENQRIYLDAIKNNDIIFGVGSSGSGKTFIPIYLALDYLLNNRISKIIIARPAVCAGESLGHLPGDLKEKLDPYLRPLYDSFEFHISKGQIEYLIKIGMIEIAPIGFLRGRTLSNAFIIVDEAQNTTITQMKMILSRLGEGSKLVITGDNLQIDLPNHVISGLDDAIYRLRNIKGVEICFFDKKDVCRHILVSKILSCYEDGE